MKSFNKKIGRCRLTLRSTTVVPTVMFPGLPKSRKLLVQYGLSKPRSHYINKTIARNKKNTKKPSNAYFGNLYV